MHSQNKDSNHILKIREILFYPTGGGELTLPNNKAFTRSNSFKINCRQNHHSTTEEAGAGAEARHFISESTGNRIF